MEQNYDFIILGTGLKECILGGLLSREKKSILQMDRNAYYGGESASLNLLQLHEKFVGDGKKPEEIFGRPREYCVDLCPKFLMACGNLVKVLLHTKVTRYLEFKSVHGSYVYKDKKLHKVPSTIAEAGKTSLMGMFQKMRYKSFLTYVGNYDEKDSKTHSGLDLTKMTAKALYAHFKCDSNTQAFTGHAVALYLNDDYLEQPALEFVKRQQLYAFSVSRYGNSPYIYPIYGLGGLPEGFSRLCAINGGVFMLNKPVAEILYDEAGRVRGVLSEGKEAYCKQIIADPSYFAGTDKVKKTGQVARCIAICTKPIAGTNTDSAQIIIPSKQITGRNKDIYLVATSWLHKVCAEGKYIMVMSAEVEGDDIPLLATDKKACQAGVQRELKSALALLAKDGIMKLFMWVTDSFEAVNDPSKDGCYITSTYDATTHFETVSKEVVGMYSSILGKELDLTVDATPEALQDPDAAEAEAKAKEEAEAPKEATA